MTRCLAFKLKHIVHFRKFQTHLDLIWGQKGVCEETNWLLNPTLQTLNSCLQLSLSPTSVISSSGRGGSSDTNSGGLIYTSAKKSLDFVGSVSFSHQPRANVPQHVISCVQTSQPVWSLNRLWNTSTRGDLLPELPLNVHPHTSGLVVDWYWTLRFWN